MDGGVERKVHRRRRSDQRRRDSRKYNCQRPCFGQLPRKPRRAPLHLHPRPKEDNPSGDCPMTAQRFSVDPSEFATKRVLVTGGTKGMGQYFFRSMGTNSREETILCATRFLENERV